LRKRKARGAVWLEHGRGIHGGLLLALVSRRIRSRCRRRKMPRTGSGGKGDILNADVRPYRSGTAAASDENGRGVDHGPGYKAAPGWRQDG
jgi:hypothetical protein